MSRKARKQYKQERAAEIDQKRRQTDGNPDYKRMGSRDLQHKKTTEMKSEEQNSGNHRPSNIIEAFYDVRLGDFLVFYRGMQDVPQEIFGKKALVGIVGDHPCAYVNVGYTPVKKIPHRLGIDERDFWPGRYAVHGCNLLLQIGSGSARDSEQSYRTLLGMKEKACGASEPKAAETPRMQAPAQTLERRAEQMYVFYHDYKRPDGERDVLIPGDVNGEVSFGRAVQAGTVRGYHALRLRIASSIEPARVAELLGVETSSVRVGHYSDYGGHYFEELFERDWSEWGLRNILEIAKLHLPKTPEERPLSINPRNNYK